MNWHVKWKCIVLLGCSDLFDPDAGYKKRFAAWEIAYLDRLDKIDYWNSGKSSVAHRYQEYISTFDDRVNTVDDIVKDMLHDLGVRVSLWSERICISTSVIGAGAGLNRWLLLKAAQGADAAITLGRGATSRPIAQQGALEAGIWGVEGSSFAYFWLSWVLQSHA